MELTKALEKSELIIIEGESKSGKLTFAINVNINYMKNNTPLLIFSSLPRKLMEKRLMIIENFVDDKTKERLKETTLLCLRENFRDLKQFYDFHMIIDDIKKVIEEKESRNIIFHRLDQMFEVQDGNDAEWFIDTLLKLKEEMGLKISATLDSSSDSYTFLHSYLKNYIDIEFKMEKSEYREIEVISSIFPIDTLNYRFYKNNNALYITPSSSTITYDGIQTEPDDMILPEKSSNDSSTKRKVVLYTHDNALASMHRYIFDTEEFEVYISNNLLETISLLEKKVDLLIYNYSELNETKEMHKVIKRYGYNGHMICISAKNYIRSTDRMSSVNYGCEDIFPINFILEEYILSIERTLNERFYSSKINEIPPHREVVNDIEKFCRIVSSLIEKHIYFTILEVESDVDKDILKKRFREKDMFCYLDEILLVLLLNSRERVVKEKIIPNLNFGKRSKFMIKQIINAYTLKDTGAEPCKRWKDLL